MELAGSRFQCSGNGCALGVIGFLVELVAFSLLPTTPVDSVSDRARTLRLPIPPLAAWLLLRHRRWRSASAGGTAVSARPVSKGGVSARRFPDMVALGEAEESAAAEPSPPVVELYYSLGSQTPVRDSSASLFGTLLGLFRPPG